MSDAHAGHVDDGSRVPYRRWSRWVAGLRRRALLARAAESGADPHDRVYLAYGVVLLALVYGPILWSALAQAVAAAQAGGRPAPSGVVVGGVVAATVVLVLGVAAAAGLAVARAGGPLWTTPAEATFALGGQFRPRQVLGRRSVLLVLAAAGTGAFAATAAAVGLAPGAVDAQAGLPLAAWAGAGAALAQVPLAVAVAAQTTLRRAAVAATAVLLVLGAAGVSVAASRGGLLGGGLDPVTTPAVVTAVAVGVLGLACAGWVAGVLPDRLDVDRAAAGQTRTVTAGRGLVGGESGALADVLGPRTYAGRRAGLPRRLLHRAPLVARDLLGLRRRPGALVASLVVGTVGALLVRVGADGGPALAAVAGAAALYGAARTWADGLHAFAAQPQPGALLPGSVRRAVAGHLVVPAVLALLVAGAATAAAGADVALPVVLVAGTVLAVRAWVAGATAAPPGLFTPMMTPNGDMSMLVLGAWYLRGWLVVVAVAWLLHRAGPGGAPTAAVVVLALVAGLAAAAARRFARA
ncbi:hypothetical protein [Isoptericola sp. NPDC057191]|uniref:hypothetical protein n=1 Tax=Isoptericola sp. NPDC057191 TaxID=3346041 RepID=UPI00362A4A40